MADISCSKIAEFVNPNLTNNLQGPDIQVNIDINSPDAQKKVAEECMPFLTNILSGQVGKYIEQTRHQNYKLNVDDSKSPSIKYNTLIPSLFELSASQIAHYLFPENFAKYKFVIKPNMGINDSIRAGYLLSELGEEDPKCEHLEGIENVYATAFYLGLEIRSHKCVKSGDKTYLFIDDFSHRFHEVDIEQKMLSEEYRDHKIYPLEKGALFPTSFLNMQCGEWIERGCDVGKLRSAYERIKNTPKEKINQIIDTAIAVLKSIECQEGCKFSQHYRYMDEEAKEILVNNHDGISAFLTE